jgi:HEAT repeat protein
MCASRSMMLVLCVALGSAVTDSLAVEGEPAALVSALGDTSNPTAAQSAYLSLCRMLRNGPPETVKAIQDALCQQLAATTEPTIMRRVCLALRNAPSDTAVLTVVGRLQADTSPRLRAAACQSLCDLVSRRQPTDPSIAGSALSRLGAIGRDRQAPLSLKEAAVLAMGAFGSAGFDSLMELQADPKQAKRVQDVFHTALGSTGDPRALPILRVAVADSQTGQGVRIQAANAIGQLFRSAGQRGLVIEATERARCRDVLYKHLTDDTADQLFGVALKSLTEIAPIQQDPTILQAINTTLLLSNEVRREAALDVLYRTGLPDGIAVDLVQSCAKSSPSASVRSAAKAVLDRSHSPNEADAPESP